MTAHSIFHQLTNVLGVSLLNIKVFSRGLVAEVPFDWNRGHGVSLVGVLWNCRAWGMSIPAGQHHLVELLYFPGKSEGWALSQAKACSCLNYQSDLADLKICGVNVWNWTVKSRARAPELRSLVLWWVTGLEAGVPEWAMGHKPSYQPANPGKALELSWSQFYLLLCILWRNWVGQARLGRNISQSRQSVPGWWRGAKILYLRFSVTLQMKENRI